MRVNDLFEYQHPEQMAKVKSIMVGAGLDHVGQGEHAIVFRNKSAEIVRIFWRTGAISILSNWFGNIRTIPTSRKFESSWPSPRNPMSAYTW